MNACLTGSVKTVENCFRDQCSITDICILAITNLKEISSDIFFYHLGTICIRALIFFFLDLLTKVKENVGPCLETVPMF